MPNTIKPKSNPVKRQNRGWSNFIDNPLGTLKDIGEAMVDPLAFPSRVKDAVWPKDGDPQRAEKTKKDVRGRFNPEIYGNAMNPQDALSPSLQALFT